MDGFFQDVRYGIRTFIRQSGFALTAVLALTLGIGANTAVFSVVYAVLLKPLPDPNPEVMALTSAGLLAVAAIACLVPALRASG
jgi:ABC-type antimicrobial peptide transport system permease subunit